MAPDGLLSVVQDITWVNSQQSHAPSNSCIDNNLENAGVPISTVLCLQLYKCCLRFPWTLCLWHSRLLPLCWDAGHASLSLLCHRPWLEISFSLKVSLKWINSGEMFQFRELISWKIPSRLFTKALTKAAALFLPIQWLLLTQKHIHGLKKGSCKSRGSERLNGSREEMEQDLRTSVIVVSHGNLRHQAWLCSLLCVTASAAPPDQ